eukprot:m.178031 g.178031  ORF g.178031 m.178031 type:complete len:58 (-) comp25354_c0_seq2:99-272(-)
MCLVPLADLLNTDFDPALINVDCQTDDSKGKGIDASFVCSTTKLVSTGEEVGHARFE